MKPNAHPEADSRLQGLPLGRQPPEEACHKDFPGEPLAETWDLSCHPDGPSRIANGAFAGRTLREYLSAMGPRALGGNCQVYREFPILIKFIDAREPLSIQVHPDNLDALERLRIQEGMTMLYPVSCIGAHVSACPNHEVGRVTPFSTRANVATFGTFGYELDVTALSPDEQAQIPGQIARYKAHRALIQTGDYYRLASLRDGALDAEMVADKRGEQALVCLTRALNAPNQRPKRIRLRGLIPDATYVDSETGRSYPGEALMHVGLPIDLPDGDFQSKLIHLLRTSK